MARKKKAVITESRITQDLCRQMLGAPFTETGLNGNTVNLDIIAINDRGVIVLPKEVRGKLDYDCGCECMVLTMNHNYIIPAIMLIPVCRLCVDNNRNGPPSEDYNCSD